MLALPAAAADMNKVVHHVFPVAETGFDPQAIARSLLGHRRAGDLRDAAHVRLPRPAVEARADGRRGAAADHRRRQDLHVQDQEGRLLHARSGVQGPEAGTGGQRFRLFAEAADRSQDSLAVRVPRRRQDRRPRRGGRGGEEERQVRLRRQDRRARDRRPLHAAHPAQGYRLRAVVRARPRADVRRRARSRRGLRRRVRPHPVEPGRHRPVQAREVGALVEDLARGQSRLPRLRLGLQGRRRRRGCAASSRR